MTDLSVVVPAYNEARDIALTLRSLDEDAAASPFSAEIVVVDDGSGDGTAAVARTVRTRTPVRVISQENTGRFGARKTGIEQACGTYVLLFDAGLALEAGSLRFLHERLALDPGDSVWTGHTYMAKVDRYERFWSVLTGIAWSAYLDEPREVHFGAEDFDRYPQGGGCFFAPRALLLEGCASFRSYYSDSRHASDDTALIRWIAGRHEIALAPPFAYTYRFSRTTLRGFVRHAFHRGVHFVDGHGRVASRFFPYVVAFYPASAAAAALAVLRPVAVPIGLGTLVLGAAVAAAAKRRAAADVLSFASLAPAFVLAHGSGMWVGLARAARDRRRSRSRA